MKSSILLGCILSFLTLNLILFSCEKSNDISNQNDEVLFPKGGEFLIKGKRYSISWFDHLSSEVRIKLYKADTNYFEITPSTNNTGEYQWILPPELEVGIDYRIKIFSNSNDFLFYESQKPFTIIEPSETSTFIDPRDDRIYKIVKIGAKWWFAENSKFEIATGSYCYQNDYSYFETYGKLYTYSAALSSNPPGWHLPSDDEWKEFESYLGFTLKEIDLVGDRGPKINAVLGADGLNFNIQYAGYYQQKFTIFNYANSKAYFWSSTCKISETNYWYRTFSLNNIGIYRGTTSGLNALSVRYIKD